MTTTVLRRPRGPLAALVASAFLLAGLTVPSAPALAASNGTGQNPGSGGGGASSCTSGNCSTSVCKNGEGWVGDQKWFDKVGTWEFSKCVTPDETTYNNYQVCNIGYETYRFYSTFTGADRLSGGQVRSWTRSRMLFRDPCTESNGGVVYAPDPRDTGRWDGSTPTLFSNTYVRNGLGTTTVQLEAGSDGSGPRRVVTYPPVKRVGSCSNLMGPQPDPIKRVLSNRSTPQNVSLGNKAAAQLQMAYRQWKARDGETDESARAAINIRATGGIGPSGSTMNAVYPDGDDCSSNLDFVNLNSSANVMVGVCYVPLWAHIRSTSTGQWDLVTVNGRPGYNELGGLRYGVELGQSGNYPAWRAIMASDRASRTDAWTPNYPYDKAAGFSKANPKYSVRPYSGHISAARALRDYAKCYQGGATGTGAGASTPNARYEAAMNLTMSAPTVAYARGAYKPATVKVTWPSDPICTQYVNDPTDDPDRGWVRTGTGTCSGFGVSLDEVNFSLAFSNSSGRYTQCATPQSKRCAYYVAKNDAAGATVHFYTATPPGSPMQVRVVNPWASISWQSGAQRTAEVTISDGFGDRTYSEITIRVPTVAGLDPGAGPVAVGLPAPATFPVIGATVRPGS